MRLLPIVAVLIAIVLLLVILAVIFVIIIRGRNNCTNSGLLASSDPTGVFTKGLLYGTHAQWRDDFIHFINDFLRKRTFSQRFIKKVTIIYVLSHDLNFSYFDWLTKMHVIFS